jgi:hypothetical protein
LAATGKGLTFTVILPIRISIREALSSFVPAAAASFSASRVVPLVSPAPQAQLMVARSEVWLLAVVRGWLWLVEIFFLDTNSYSIVEECVIVKCAQHPDQQTLRTMANTPAACTMRKQDRKNYHLSDSSSDSSTHSSSENVSHSHRKKRTNRVCAPAARKVSIDNDDNENQQKKAADPILMLKLNMADKPGMFILNSFKAFLGLGNHDQNMTPMLANTPVVPAEELQALYENQVAVPKGATNRVCREHTLISRKDLDCVSRSSKGRY